MRNLLEMLRGIFRGSRQPNQPSAGAAPTTVPTVPTAGPTPSAPPPTPSIAATAPPVPVPHAETDAASPAAQAPIETQAPTDLHGVQAGAEPAAPSSAPPPIVQEIVVGPVGQTKVIALSAEEGATPDTPAMPSTLDTLPAAAPTDELATEPPPAAPAGDHSRPEAATQEALPQPAPGLPERPPQPSVPTTPSTTDFPGDEEGSGHEPET